MTMDIASDPLDLTRAVAELFRGTTEVILPCEQLAERFPGTEKVGWYRLDLGRIRAWAEAQGWTVDPDPANDEVRLHRA